MIIESKEIYRCEHCKKLYQIKNACATHEQWCNRNPKNQKKCISCEHLTEKMVEFHFDTHRGTSSREVKVLMCEAKNEYLYPLATERKNNAYAMEDLGDGETENNPMPKECDKYKTWL